MESLESRMEEELIEAVRAERCLYDSKHPDYMKSKLKEAIWNQIARDLSFKNGNEAKKTWEKLRNNHRDALRRRKHLIPKGKSGVRIKPWRFQENMAFLLPHMGKGLTINDPHEYLPNDEAVYLDTVEFDGEEYLLEIDSDQEFQVANDETNESSELSSSDLTTNKFKKRRRRTRNSNFFSRSVEDDEKSGKRTKERDSSVTSNDVTVSNVKNDPLFHFFISMYETTKTLPPLSQHTIKKNLFSLVSQEESKNLMQGTSYTLSDVPKSEGGMHSS